MFVGAALSSHPVLTSTQAAVYTVHDGTLFEGVRDVTAGTTLSWRNLGQPRGTCIAYPPFVIWSRDQSSTPIRIFCTTTDGSLAACLLDARTRSPLGWEIHTIPGAARVFTPPGATIEYEPQWVFSVGRWMRVRVPTKGPVGMMGRLIIWLRLATAVDGPNSVFVGSTDGHLWELMRRSGAFSWTDHGAPPGHCIAGRPMTVLSAPAESAPRRIFAATRSGAMVERVIVPGGASLWVDHGRPAKPSGAPGSLATIFPGGVVATDTAGAPHVIVLADDQLHALRVSTMGAPGSWSALAQPPASSVRESTWTTTPPTVGLATPGVGSVTTFVVGSRQTRSGTIVGRVIEEVLQVRYEPANGQLSHEAVLGEPDRPLFGTDRFVINHVAGVWPVLGRVYASSRAAFSATESLDEWGYATTPPTRASLGLPPVPGAPCNQAPQRMTGCGGPMTYGVGSGL
ncbi:MAG: hypothetical protein JNJ98_21120 [Gemmatimonadetes bacterium]|nr:hypothetical protein [Gemmatimonadota bacterium]